MDKPRAIDQLKELPVEQRLIFMLQQLDRLQKSNLSRLLPEITKKHMLENVARNAAVKAYKDTSNFIVALFEKELKAALPEITKEKSNIIMEG